MMYYYAYEEFVSDTKVLVNLCQDFQADVLLAIARGGLTLGHAFAMATDSRHLYAINSILYEGQERGNRCEIFNMPDLSKAKRVLILDDIVDTGKTLKEVLHELQTCYPQVEFKIASLFYKESAVIQPDFSLKKTSEWIEFFWEKDYL